MPVHVFLRSLPSFILVTLLAIIAADHLLADCSPGWVLGLLLIASAGMVVARHPHLLRDRRARPLLLLPLPLAAACAYDHGALAPTLGALALVTMAWWGRGARYASSPRWLAALVRLPPALLTQLRTDRRLLRAWRKLHQRRLPGAGALVWLLPMVLGACFAGLFAAANPIIGQWLADFGGWLAEWLDPTRWLPTPGRIALWWGIGSGTWILLRLRPPHLPPTRLAIPATEVDHSGLVLRSLLVVNAVFAMQVGLDLVYLVGGLRLPLGMTYATYAHRGAWPLLVAALVSAALVLVAFRPGGAAERSPWARRLVLLWLGQNVALTIAAAWRLWLYVDAYGLSSWRLGAAIWMGLVVVGLILIAVRIAGARGNRWLIDANVLATLVTLALCCWLDVSGTVAWNNVRHCREAGGDGVAIDLGYLREIGPEAAPALAWLGEHSSDPRVAREARTLANQWRAETRTLLSDWRSWTWVRATIAALPGPERDGH